MNKTTVTLTKEEFKEIITTMKKGGAGFRPNERVATALTLEANLGIRIEDILELKLDNIIRDGERYRLNITEHKTNKKRYFTVPLELYQFMEIYCLKQGIDHDKKMFDISERAVQKHLGKVVDYLGFSPLIGTHSFRKFFATQIYNNNGYNIMLVQQLLQHSSPLITQRYIGISSPEIEKALKEHITVF